MRIAVGTTFFLAMVPLVLTTAELRTGGHRTSNVQGTALQEAHHRFLRRGGGGRGRRGGRRGRGDDDSADLPSPAPEAPSPTPGPTAEVPSPAPEPPTTLDIPSPTPEPTGEVPSPTPELSPVPTMDSDMELLLELHNEARCLHNADALTYSDDVATSAMAHAEDLVNSCGELFHSTSEDRNGYGENLFLCGTTGSVMCYSPEEAMEALYEDEIQVDSLEDYGGHATQILWKSTTELGCAVLSCDSDPFMYTYLVCQYNPAGNLMANLEYEVELLTDNSC